MKSDYGEKSCRFIKVHLMYTQQKKHYSRYADHGQKVTSTNILNYLIEHNGCDINTYKEEPLGKNHSGKGKVRKRVFI